jgi:hypothetical protein
MGNMNGIEYRNIERMEEDFERDGRGICKEWKRNVEKIEGGILKGNEGWRDIMEKNCLSWIKGRR